MLAGQIIKLLASRSARRFEAATHRPEAMQEAKLKELVQRNKDTEYGKRHRFDDVKTVADYQARVPIVTYEDIKDLMLRVTTGARGIFTAEDAVMFAQTSGTTGDPKYIPITPTCQGREHKDVMRTWLYHAIKAHPGIFRTKVVSLVSPAVEGTTPSGIAFGSASGHIYKTMPGIIRSCYAIPYEVFEIKDYEAKYFALMRIGLLHDVRFVSTANPSSIVKMCEKADQHAEAIIKDVRDGTLSRDFAIEEKIRHAILPRLRKEPERAAALERMRAARRGRLIPKDYWPNLELIGCWKGGTVGSYLAKFPEWFYPDGGHPVAVRDWGFLSSEARCSIPLTDSGSGGVLTVATNFYEFVKVADLEAKPDARSDWRFHLAHELEIGKEYYIFFSTTGGLYRYDINDVVKVVGTYNRAPVIEFLRKGRGVTNITGEKLSVNQVIQAFDDAARDMGITIDHFKAEADVPGSRYIFKAEIEAGLSEERGRDLLRRLDKRLMGINIEYRGKRDSQRLKDPVLHLMKHGWYEANKKRQVEQGKRLFQAKTVILAVQNAAGERDPFIAAVIELAERERRA